jgi:hypothetical protein
MSVNEENFEEIVNEIESLKVALQEYLEVRFDERETQEIDQIIFGLKSSDAASNETTIELARAYLFLQDFDFHPFAQSEWPEGIRIQIKIYALKAHLEKVTFSEEEQQLFNPFFEKLLPLFPGLPFFLWVH